MSESEPLLPFAPKRQLSPSSDYPPIKRLALDKYHTSSSSTDFTMLNSTTELLSDLIVEPFEEAFIPRKDKGKGKAIERSSLDLPDEIWGRVFEFYYESCRNDWHDRGTWRNAMNPLILSRDHSRMAQTALYRHPVLDVPSIPRFLKCLRHPSPFDLPAKAAMVRHLTVQPSLKSSPLNRPFNHKNVDNRLPELLSKFGALNSFTLKQAMILVAQDAMILFKALRKISPKKVRLEIAMWNLYDSPYSQEFVAASERNVHHHALTFSTDQPRATPQIVRAWHNGRFGEDYARLTVQEAWRDAIVDGSELDLPSTWTDPPQPEGFPVQGNAHQPPPIVPPPVLHSFPSLAVPSLSTSTAAQIAPSNSATPTGITGITGSSASRSASSIANFGTGVSRVAARVGGQNTSRLRTKSTTRNIQRAVSASTTSDAATSSDSRAALGAETHAEGSEDELVIATPSDEEGSQLAKIRPPGRQGFDESAIAGRTTHRSSGHLQSQQTAQATIPSTGHGTDSVFSMDMVFDSRLDPSIPPAARLDRTDHIYVLPDSDDEDMDEIMMDTLAWESGFGDVSNGSSIEGGPPANVRTELAISVGETSNVATVPPPNPSRSISRPRGARAPYDRNQGWAPAIPVTLGIGTVNGGVQNGSHGHVLAHEIRRDLLRLLMDQWRPTLEAFSFVATDPLSSLIVRSPDLTFWANVAVPHIRVHLPRTINSLAVFKGHEEEKRDRLRRRNAEPVTGPNPVVNGPTTNHGLEDDELAEKVVGGGGMGAGLLHEDVKLFEIEINTMAEMMDDVWIRCGDQLPSQVCRLLVGDHDWRDVRIGPESVPSLPSLSSLHPISPAGYVSSPTYSFESLDLGEDSMSDISMGGSDDNSTYDEAAARAQVAKIAERKAKRDAALGSIQE